VLLRREDSGRYHDTVCSWHGKTVEVVYFAPGSDVPIWVKLAEVHARQVVWMAFYGVHSEGTETYTYRDGKLVGSYQDVVDHDAVESLAGEYQYSYDHDGELQQISYELKRDSRGPVDMRGGKHIVYLKMGKSEYADLYERVRVGLVKAIPEMIRRARLGELAFAILLAYMDQNPFPPAIAVANESYRQSRIAAVGPKASCDIWVPGHHTTFQTPELESWGEELKRDCELLNAAMSLRQPRGEPAKLLNAVATELNRQRWDDVLRVTDDFVVLPVDLPALDDLDNNAQACIPAAKLKELRSRHML
jgi:hypothetical protein